MKARNDYVLILDHDVLLFDKSLIDEMCHHIIQPNVFACGILNYRYNDKTLLFPSCTIFNKKMYLENNVLFSGSEPCYEAFLNALLNGQALVKVGCNDRTFSMDKRFFHLNGGFRKPYPLLFNGGLWRESFDKWKADVDSSESLDDYAVDDGMDFLDMKKAFYHYYDLFNHHISNRLPFYIPAATNYFPQLSKLFFSDLSSTLKPEIPYIEFVLGKKILVVSQNDFLKNFNDKNSTNGEFQYYRMENPKEDSKSFFELLDVCYWDIVLISGDSNFYDLGEKIYSLGGRALNFGQDVPNDGSCYKYVDPYPNYGKRTYEKYLYRYR
jgi:hypothetical protein